MLAAWLDARRKSRCGVSRVSAGDAWVCCCVSVTEQPHRALHRKPELVYTPTEFNSAVLAECPTLHETYAATPFLTNGHVGACRGVEWGVCGGAEATFSAWWPRPAFEACG